MKERTIPALPNRYPFNNMLLDGKLILPKSPELRIPALRGVKTREWEWKHRGLTLLYTSRRPVIQIAQDYGYPLDDRFKEQVGTLVGFGMLHEVRPLKKRERHKLFLLFNPFATQGDRAYHWKYGSVHSELMDCIAPGEFGYFFTFLEKFRKPIPFKPPRGAVRTFKVPLDLVARELKRHKVKLD